MNEKVTRGFYYFAVFLLVISTVSHFLTYIPSLRTSNTTLNLILGFAIFPSFYAAFMAAKSLKKKGDFENYWKNVFAGAPNGLKRSIWYVVIYVGFNFFYSFLVLNKDGSPNEIEEGKYVLEKKETL